MAGLVWTSDPSVICNVSDPIYTFTKGACKRLSITAAEGGGFTESESVRECETVCVHVCVCEAGEAHTQKGTVAPF